jgi:NAD+ diphosphatase
MHKKIIFYQHTILVKNNNGEISLPDSEQLNNLELDIEQTLDSFVTLGSASENLISGLQFMTVRQAINFFDDLTIVNISYSYQLHNYYRTHKYCGVCGGKVCLRPQISKFVFCVNCNTEVYPHIAPCIIVRIHSEDKILLARGINAPANTFGLIAGFVEVGESLEEAVHREVLEEVGILIKNINYWGSQSWCFPNNSLMVGFTADYASGALKIDPTEIEQADFYSVDAIPGLPSSSFSIASKMIHEFIIKN